MENYLNIMFLFPFKTGFYVVDRHFKSSCVLMLFSVSMGSLIILPVQCSTLDMNLVLLKYMDETFLPNVEPVIMFVLLAPGVFCSSYLKLILLFDWTMLDGWHLRHEIS